MRGVDACQPIQFGSYTTQDVKMKADSITYLSLFLAEITQHRDQSRMSQ
jgi:hypothetical protein